MRRIIVRNYNFRDIFMILSGMLLIISLFFSWLSLSAKGGVESLRGFHCILSGGVAYAPEIIFLLLFGLLFFVGIIIWREVKIIGKFTRIIHPNLLFAIIYIIAIFSMVIPIEVLSKVTLSAKSNGYECSVGIGFWISLIGGIIATIALTLTLVQDIIVSTHMRKVGVVVPATAPRQAILSPTTAVEEEIPIERVAISEQRPVTQPVATATQYRTGVEELKSYLERVGREEIAERREISEEGIRKIGLKKCSKCGAMHAPHEKQCRICGTTLR